MKITSKKKKQKTVSSFASQRRFILNEDSTFFVKEAYKTLRTNIRFFLNQEGCKKFCITSSAMSEGKSITILNLAISFAENGQKVLLIDADMRRPAQARLLSAKVTTGLSNILAGLATEKEAIHKEVYPNLDMLFSGDIPPNPSELLGSDRMKELLARLSLDYDYILVDSPPVNAVADARVIASLLDGVLYLVRQGKTEKDAVARGVNQLKLTDAKLLGFILNGIIPENKKYYYSDYR